MKSTFRRIKNVPLFPIVPFVPLVLAGGLIALEIFALARLRRLARSVDELLAAKAPEPQLT